MVSVLTSSAVDHGFKPWSNQSKDAKRSCLLCEPVSLQVEIVTSCDAVSSCNRQDLIQSLVQTHYVYCGDKKNGATLHKIFSAVLFCHDVISLECGVKHINVSNV
jgi:hypothetical protein